MCGPAEALDAGGVMKLALKSAKDNQTEKKITLAVIDPCKQ